jgi:hypothetical protein
MYRFEIETTTETPPAPTEETPKEEPAPKEPEVTKEPEATAEKKSIFTLMCGCLGGSAPAPDTDTKEAPVKAAGDDDEKEETEEKPAEVPAVIEPAEV